MTPPGWTRSLPIYLPAPLLLILPLLLQCLARRLYGVDSTLLVFALAVPLLLAGLAVAAGRRAPGISATLLAVTLTLLAAIHGASLLSNLHWGDSLSYDLALESLRRPLTSLAMAGLSPATGAWVLLAALLGGVLMLFVLQRSITAWLGLCSRLPRRGLVLALLLLPAAGYSAFALGTRPERLAGEPLLSFFKLVRTSSLMSMDNDRMLAALRDQAALEAYPSNPDFERRNVILIFSDALRADRMGVYGYARETTPFLSSLAAEGHLAKVDTALSTCSESFCGIATTLASHPYNEVSSRSLQLGALLRRVGYRSDYYLSGDHHYWPYLWEFYGKDVDGIHDAVERKAKDPNDDAETLEAFRNVAPYDGQPRFFYFFLMSSHLLGTRHPQHEPYQPAQQDLALVTRLVAQAPTAFSPFGVPLYPPLEPAALENLGNRYDNGIVQADAMIRELFTTLREKGYLQNSLVVITADHGDGLGERGHVAHARFLYQKDMHIPLLIYDDQPQRYRNLEFATSIDIAPTLLERLGLPLPASWQGVPLTREPAARTTLHQTRWRQRPCVALVERSTTGGLEKYIRCWSIEGRESEELFDLRNDPEETRNLMDNAPAGRIDAYRQRTEALFGRLVCGGGGDSCER